MTPLSYVVPSLSPLLRSVTAQARRGDGCLDTERSALELVDFFLSPSTKMLKRKCASHDASPAVRRKTQLAEQPSILNATDFLTLEPLPQGLWAELDVVFDTSEEGTSVFLRTSLRHLVEAAKREGVEALHPYTGAPLADAVLRELEASRDWDRTMMPPLADALRDREIPTWPCTKQLMVDICVRLGFYGHFITPQMLWEQRTGRMRRIHQTVSVLFYQNFTGEERRALAPPHGFLPPAIGWTTWAAWGQRAMLALAACAGERSRAADTRLKKRGASVAIAALSATIPEVRQEFGNAISIQGASVGLQGRHR